MTDRSDGTLNQAGDQPRHYTLPKSERILMWVCFPWAGLTILALLGLTLFTAGFPNRTLFWTVTTCSPAALVIVSILLRRGLRLRISLHADYLEYDSGAKLTVIRRDEIGGLRAGVGDPVLRVFRKPDLKPLAALSLNVEKDEAFWSWFEGFPDLDAEEARADAAAMLANPKLGSTEEERLLAAVTTMRALVWLIRLSWAAALWCAVYPRPYQLALLASALFPVTAFWLLFKAPHLVQFQSRAHLVKTGLDSVIVVPSLALGLRALLDTQPADWLRLAVFTLLLTLGICYALHRAHTKIEWPAFLLTALLLSSYPMATISLANEIYDGSVPARIPVTVEAKQIHRMMFFARSFQLSPGGPWEQPHRRFVSWSLFAQTEVGDTRCLLVYPGALGIRWWRLRKSCSD